jgi:hypothetical protein
MRNTNNNPLHKRQGKDTKRIGQYKAVFAAFFRKPSTMKMVDMETGIMRENVCWYCRKFRKLDVIKPVRKGICPITKHRATFWTTNPELFPSSTQLTLF